VRLLLITYEFPPKGGTGVQRALKIAKYLALSGWGVSVLTVEDPPTAILDPPLLQELPGSVRVLRAWSLEPTRLVQALRGRRTSPESTSPDAQGSRDYTSLPPWGIRFIQGFFLPDEKRGWIRRAVRMGVEAHHRDPFSVILASGPPFSALLVGMRLSRRLGIPWVADLRDPLFGGYFFRPITPVHRWWFRRFEARVVASAARVVVATEGMREALLERHSEAGPRVIIVRNGFDPDDYRREIIRSERFTVSYVGAFQGSITPDVFLASCEKTVSQDDGIARDLDVRFVGPRDSRTMAVVRESEIADKVDVSGFVVHADAVDVMCLSSVLLLVVGPESESKLILTSKLPEYLAAGRPILALVPPDGVAAEAVRRSGVGIVVHPEDVEGTVQALLTLYREWKEGRERTPDPAVVAEFDRERLVERLGGILEDVVREHE